MKPEPTPLPVELPPRPPLPLIVVWIVTTAGLSAATTEVTEVLVLATTDWMLFDAAVDAVEAGAAADPVEWGTSAIVAPEASTAERKETENTRARPRDGRRGVELGAWGAGASGSLGISLNGSGSSCSNIGRLRAAWRAAPVGLLGSHRCATATLNLATFRFGYAGHGASTRTAAEIPVVGLGGGSRVAAWVS